MSLYNGFSTINFKSGIIAKGQHPSSNIDKTTKPFNTQLALSYNGNNTFKLHDIPLVERNLLNHIYTQRGSRIMMPNFGTRIHEILFEPINEISIEKLRNELTNVIQYDPRVSLVKLKLDPDYDKNSIYVTITLNYIELKITRDMTFNLEFN